MIRVKINDSDTITLQIKQQAENLSTRIILLESNGVVIGIRTYFEGNLGRVWRAGWSDIVGEQDILWLEISVHDALGVNRSHRLR